MNLGSKEKKVLLGNAKLVYKAYSALDFFKNYEFTSQTNNKFNLQSECEDLIKSKKTSKTFYVNKVLYELKVNFITPTPSGALPSYKIELKTQKKERSKVKALADYNTSEAMALICEQQFILEKNNNKYHLANIVNKDLTIGGFGKLDLYRTHLTTLLNIIQKIEKEKDISNLLVALATGSGKTYVQALWLLVLGLSGNHAVLGVPDKLLMGFKDQLAALIPNKWLDDNLKIIRQGPKKAEDEALISSLANPKTKSTLILGSCEQLLDDHYQSLIAANPQKTFMSFDEQHLLMKSETRRVKLFELSKRFMAMFLSATPSKATYELAGSNPVAMMSSGQKQKCGQGNFPELVTINSKKISDQYPIGYKFWTSDFRTKLSKRMRLSFSFALDKLGFDFLPTGVDYPSVGLTIVEDLPAIAQAKPGESSLRWGLQVPMARKILFIVNDNEALVNLCMAMETGAARGESRKKVYKNGTVKQNSDVLNTAAPTFFPDDVNQTIATTEYQNQKAKFIETVLACSDTPEAAALGEVIAQKSLKEQIKYNIFHAMVEYVIHDLTEMDEIDNNRLRKNDPLAFQKLVRDKLSGPKRDATYYKNKLSQKIDAAGAQEISTYMDNIYKILKTYAQNNANPTDFNRLIDNWGLDYASVDKIFNNDFTFNQNFSAYANKHALISVMSKMTTAETPIEESKPFFNFREEQVKVFEDDGSISKKAKKKKRSIFERFIPNFTEVHFVPKDAGFSQDICDNYFKLGFVGALASNTKTEGFNDPHLSTVVNIAPDKYCSTNNPASLIQGLGRNRALDDTILSAYVHALGRNETSPFDLNKLKKDDYYPDLFKAQKEFNEKSLPKLGEYVAKEIIEEFYNSIEPDDTIDQQKLKRQVLKIVARSLREINNQNEHKIKLSRSQLIKVISVAMKEVNKEIKHIQEPYKLGFRENAILKTLNFFSSVYQFFQSYPADKDIKRFKAQGYINDEIYLKILKNISFKDVLKFDVIGKEFAGWMMKAQSFAMYKIYKNLDSYLSDTAKPTFMQIQPAMAGFLAEFVVPEKRQKVLGCLNAYPGFLLLLKNVNMMDLINPMANSYKDSVLNFLKAIPGLDELKLSDIVNAHPQHQTTIAPSLTVLSSLDIDAVLNKAKLTDLAAEVFAPMVFNKEFYKLLTKYIGFLSKAELIKVIMSIDGYPDHEINKAKVKAEEILDFLTIIKQGDIAELKLKFLQVGNDITDIPLLKLLPFLNTVNDSIAACRLHFMNHGKFGFDPAPGSKLVDALTPSLRNIYRPPMTENGLSGFLRTSTTMLTVITATLSANSIRSRIKVASSPDVLGSLKRIQNHILNPMWWGVNMSTLGFRTIKLGRDIAYGIESAGKAIGDGFKKFINLISINTFTIKPTDNENLDTNDGAFKFSDQLNKLKPLTDKDVMKDTCPLDTITPLEDKISQGTAFFDPVKAKTGKASTTPPTNNNSPQI